MRRALALALGVALIAGATASAGSLTSARVTATPPRAGAGADYAVDLTAAEPRGAFPDRLELALPVGARLDGRAVPVRCARRRALAGRCPRASRIAHARAWLVQTATFSASDPGIVLDVAIDVYAAPTARARDLGRLEVATREGVTAIGGVAAGNVLPARAGTGPRLRIGLGLVQRAPEETITFRRVRLRLGARRGHFVLVRNPAGCSGAWAVGVALSGVAPARARLPCSTAGRSASAESPTAGR